MLDDDLDPDDFAQLLEYVYSTIWTFPRQSALLLLELAQRFVVLDLISDAERVAERQLCHNWQGCCGDCRSWTIPVAVAAEASGSTSLLDGAIAALVRQPDKVGPATPLRRRRVTELTRRALVIGVRLQLWPAPDFGQLSSACVDRIAAGVRTALAGNVDTGLLSYIERLQLAEDKLAARPRADAESALALTRALLADGCVGLPGPVFPRIPF